MSFGASTVESLDGLKRVLEILRPLRAEAASWRLVGEDMRHLGLDTGRVWRVWARGCCGTRWVKRGAMSVKSGEARDSDRGSGGAR